MMVIILIDSCVSVRLGVENLMKISVMISLMVLVMINVVSCC